MEHDELCSQPGLPTGVCFECADIRTIRSDERERAVQRVEALKWDYTHSCGELITRSRTIAAIKGEQND
jgi:hypothetical protein